MSLLGKVMIQRYIYQGRLRLKGITVLVSSIILASCSNGGSNNVGSSGNSGDASKLTFIAPNMIPSISGRNNVGYLEVDNPTLDTINGINYSLGDIIGSGNSAYVESTSAAKCREIAAGSSCTLGVVIPDGSVSGSFSLSANNQLVSSQNNVAKNKSNQSVSLLTNPVIGIGQLLYNSQSGANGVSLYYYSTVQSGLPYIVVTGVVISNQAGKFNNIVLVDNNNLAIADQQVISGNLGAGLANLNQGDTFSIVLSVPSGDNVTQTIKVRTEEVALNGTITNPQLSTTSSTLTTVSGVGIVNMLPNSIYLTSASPSQQLTFTNSGDSGALLENLVSSNPNIRVTFTPGPLGDSSTTNQQAIKAGNSSSATLELIDPSLPASSGDLTLTYNNGQETVTQSITVDQNVIPSPTPAPTPSPTPTPTPSPTPTPPPSPVPDITITPVTTPLTGIMMGNGFQFSATISGTGSSTVSAAFANPASGVITSDPSTCALDVGGTTSCTFTAITAWNTNLTNGTSLNYQVNIAATNNATINGNPLSYTESTPTIYLPQTGQTPTSPYSAPTGSDGDIHAGIPWAYVSSGSTTPNLRFTDDGCQVTDNLTGLIWIKDPSTINSGNGLSWSNALTTVASGTWCGQAVGSWRMPNFNEAMSLINFAEVDNAIWLNNQNFNNISSYDQYWTSTTIAGNSDVYVFTIIFSAVTFGTNGQDKPNPIGKLFPVRGTTTTPALVPQTGQTATLPYPATIGSDGDLQEGAAWPSPRFTTGSGIESNCITDKLTGLTWIRNPSTINSGTKLTWSSALNIADGGTWCGYSDWRMPNINEFRSLLNYAYNNSSGWLMYGSGDSTTPNCDGACFINISSDRYWTSTTDPSDTSNALCLDIQGGYSNFPKDGTVEDWDPIPRYDCAAWAVRGGK